MNTETKIRNEPTDRYQIIDGWSDSCDSIYSARNAQDAVVMADLAILRGYSGAAIADIKERKMVETVNTSKRTNGHGSVMIASELRAGCNAWAALIRAEQLYAGILADEEKVSDTRNTIYRIMQESD